MDEIEQEKTKELKKQFINTIAKRIESLNEINENAPDLKSIISFLIGSSLIEEKQIIRFMIVFSYPLILQKAKGRKQNAMYLMEDIFPLKETQIRSILKHYTNKFYFNKNLLE